MQSGLRKECDDCTGRLPGRSSFAGQPGQRSVHLDGRGSLSFSISGMQCPNHKYLGLYTAIYELNDVQCSQTRPEKCV